MVVLKKAKPTKSLNWESIVDELSRIFNLTKNEKEKVMQSPATRLTAEIAYLAGCPDADRIALAHVGTIIIASKSDKSLYRHGESLYNRIAVLDHYPGGNPEIVKAGIILLQLISLNDHRRDADKDYLKCKSNPLLDGMDYYRERDSLLNQIELIDVKVQAMYRMYIEYLPFAWWM